MRYNGSVIKERTKGLSKTINLNQLKDIERKLYEELAMISSMKSDAIRGGDYKFAESLASSEQYQRGKWGAILDLIEKLEAENEE